MICGIPGTAVVIHRRSTTSTPTATMLRNMAVAKPAHRARNIKYLIINAILITACLIFIMIDIAAFIKPIN